MQAPAAPLFLVTCAVCERLHVPLVMDASHPICPDCGGTAARRVPPPAARGPLG